MSVSSSAPSVLQYPQLWTCREWNLERFLEDRGRTRKNVEPDQTHVVLWCLSEDLGLANIIVEVTIILKGGLQYWYGLKRLRKWTYDIAVDNPFPSTTKGMGLLDTDTEPFSTPDPVALPLAITTITVLSVPTKLAIISFEYPCSAFQILPSTTIWVTTTENCLTSSFKFDEDKVRSQFMNHCFKILIDVNATSVIARGFACKNIQDESSA